MGEVPASEGKEIREKVDSLKKDFADLAQSVKAEAADRLGKARDKYLGGSCEWTKDHPAASVGIVAGVAASVGFIIGLLIGRNRG